MSHFNSTEFINCSDTGSTTRGLVRLETGLVALSLSIITIFLNILLLYAILTKPTIRSLNALIANLAFVSILAAVLGALYICGVDNLFQYVWVCSILTFFRNMITSLISLSVLSISHGWVRKVQVSSTLEGRLLVPRVIQCIWGLSLVGALPSIFFTVLVHHTHPDGQLHSVCMKSPPGDNFSLGVVYEVIRSILFYMLVPAYMIFELYKIRATVKHFLHFNMPCPRMRARVQRVRLIYINSLIFVLFWVPYGIGLSIYKTTTLQQRYERFVHHPELDCMEAVRQNSFYILVFLFYCYILVLPLVIFYSNDVFSNLHLMSGKYCCCRVNKTSQHDSPAHGENYEDVTKGEGNTTFDVSVEPLEEGIKLPEEKGRRESIDICLTELSTTRREVLI